MKASVSPVKTRPSLRRIARVMTMAMTAMSSSTMSSMSGISKREGDISNSFVSLSGGEQPPLPERYRQLKLDLIRGRETQISASWARLLRRLKEENELVAKKGPHIIPEVKSADFLEGSISQEKMAEIKKRGVVVVRGLIPEEEAGGYKIEVEEYVAKNPWTKAFPQHDPQVYELYWSPPQVKARAHPSMLALQKQLMQLFWHAPPDAPIALSQPVAYADRLRIRQPGDASFALGPHMDGGSVERWEREGYGDVYKAIFSADDGWESYDPWEAGARVDAVYDMHGGLGACSAFRMWQGWLSMSRTGPGEGTLMVNPLLQLSTAYLMLRPFFRPRNPDAERPGYLDEENWEMLTGEEMDSALQGATPGHGQELSDSLHPHLELGRCMVHVPDIRPGDYVAWHCDIDKVHAGKGDSSVLYIPVCPVTARNAAYARIQRERFLAGHPGQDFPGGEGEARHAGRPTEADIARLGGTLASRSMGLERMEVPRGAGDGERVALENANVVLGFA